MIGGYSFGACIAVEIALQLPSVAQLLLLDGSHLYTATHVKQYRTKFNEPQHAEAAVVCSLYVVEFNNSSYFYLVICISTNVYAKFK